MAHAATLHHFRPVRWLAAASALALSAGCAVYPADPGPVVYEPVGSVYYGGVYGSPYYGGFGYYGAPVYRYGYPGYRAGPPAFAPHAAPLPPRSGIRGPGIGRPGGVGPRGGPPRSR